ncbi:MAG TPA: hypothetical protein VF690_06145 [Hymenobacter sp.]
MAHFLDAARPDRSPGRGPGLLFFGLLGLGVLALAAGYAALVLSSATWAEARALDRIFPFYPWHIRPFTADDWAHTRLGLCAGAVLLAGMLLGLAFAPASRSELGCLGWELRQLWASIRQALQSLSLGQRRWALGAFAGLTLLRLYFSFDNPAYDDAVSYEVFVSKGLLATSAYYPIPNNHVLSNTLSLLFYQVSPNFWWTMRLPVLLVSSIAVVFLFAALLRPAGFQVATSATLLFSCLQLSLYHAGVGRGYWLVILLAGVVFFASLQLHETRGPHRASWAGLLLAGALGCYTVPTFVYVLASAFTWLGLGFLLRRQGLRLGQLVGVAVLTGLVAATLYAPLLLVSGFDKFVGNGYVAALPLRAFRSGMPAYLWHTEGFLAGQRTLGAVLTLAVLGAGGWLFYQARTQRLPALLSHRLRHLGGPALWFVGFPYAVILVQRVFPPERVLLYKAFFFFILVGLLLDWLLGQYPSPLPRGPRRALAVCFGLFLAYQVFTVVRVNPAARASNAAYRAGLFWLAARPPGPVLVPEPTHNLFFRFYAHSEVRQRPWQIDSDQQADTRYAYVVAFPNQRGFFQPQFAFPPAYRNQEVEIYRVPPGYPLTTQAWRH